MSQVRTIAESTITQSFLEDISDRLSENKMVRRTLPAMGRLHIDRKLPFLCIYRRPLKRKDNGTDQLIKGEASYLVASAAPKYKAGISALIRTVLEVCSPGPVPSLSSRSGRKNHLIIL